MMSTAAPRSQGGTLATLTNRSSHHARSNRRSTWAAKCRQPPSGGTMAMPAFVSTARFVVGVSWFLLLIAGQAFAAQRDVQGAQPNVVVRLEIQDAIGPATSDFFTRALARAEQRGA